MTVYSQNGWVANNRDLTSSQKIPGTQRAIRLRTGDAGYLLTHFAAWFDKFIEDIEAGQLDDWGYAERPVRGSTTVLSNHASGTAMDLNATKHPLGLRNTYTKAQMAAIRKQLKVYGGVIRWGGDYTKRADEMHFEINSTSARVAAVAKSLRTATTPPPAKDVIPGAIVDLSHVQYAANGGYFRSGQATALATATLVARWMLRLKVINDRDLRVWETFIRQGNWASAGLQYTGMVKKYQKAKGLTVDGVFGAKSAALLTHDGYRVVA